MDRIIKALAFDNQVSVTILNTTEMVNKAIKIHNLSPVCSALLGRTLTAATFMSLNLKEESTKLSITIKGDGEAGGVVVCGDSELNMRGYVNNPNVELPLKQNGKLDVSGAIGRGTLKVIKNMGLKEPYIGSVELVSGEIAEDFANYFLISDQVRSVVALGVKIGRDFKCLASGGIIIQLLPFCSDDVISKLESFIAEFSKISDIIENNSLEEILNKYFGEEKIEEYFPKYNCLCSDDVIEKLIISLGKQEAENIIETEGKLKIDCHFCDKKYEYNNEKIVKLFEEVGN